MKGLFKTRSVNGMLYPDLYGSGAFAMVDHQIAHVYIKDKTNIATIKDTLSETIGIEKVLDQDAQAEIGVSGCAGRNWSGSLQQRRTADHC
ncbi:MAG: hypothetical protein ACYSPJ_03810 [Planctomycetota bacterium]|jgi:hypothetical protein